MLKSTWESVTWWGRVSVKNEAVGVKWFQKSVAQGNAQAQVNLGKCYNKGRGIPKDEAEGVKWFQKAAEQNLG